MYSRRNRGQRGGNRSRGRGGPKQNGAAKAQIPVVQKKADAKMEDAPAGVVVAVPEPVAVPEDGQTAPVVAEANSVKGDASPSLVRIYSMPAIYNRDDFKKYLQDRFKVPILTITSPGVNSSWVEVALNTKDDQAALLKALENHVWRMKMLKATEWPITDKKRELDEDEPAAEPKKQKTDNGETSGAIMLDTLPFLNIPYEEQNRLSVQDAEMMALRHHGFLCSKNPSLLGWAEKSCEENNGFLFKIEPLKTCPTLLGYKNKCKFRIGINSDGATTVGFVLNENNNKILGVEPGDKFIHMPESMKYAAKRFQEFLRKGCNTPFHKQKKTGTWDNLLVRVAPDGALMLIGIISPNEQTDASIEKIKTDLKAFFETGDGKDCNVFSLYLQVFQEQHPNYPPDKLTLLMGKPDYEEVICGLKFFVSPFSILNINPICSENIYNSVIELADPTPDSVVIDLCAGSCGIAFTLANRVEKAYAIERKEENIRDALKTKTHNNINNVELIKGKCEDHLDGLFAKLSDKPLIVVLDPPRHGVVSSIVAQIRAQPNVKKVIYVCSNSKTGVRNFQDFAANEGREPGGQLLKGLPFLPVRCIPIDVAPYTANNTFVLLLERVDPKGYPPAKKPAPLPPPEIPRKRRKLTKVPLKTMKKVRVSKYLAVQVRNRDSVRGGPRNRGAPTPVPPPVRPLMSGFRQAPPARPPAPPHRTNYMDSNDLMECKRRIAELEERERAYKRGLSMGMQVGRFQPPPDAPGNSSGYSQSFDTSFDRPNSSFQSMNSSFESMNDSFQSFDRPVNPWENNSTPKYNDNPFGYGSHATGQYQPYNNYNNYNPPASSGYGSHATYFDEDPLPRSRFAGFGSNRANYNNKRGGPTRGATRTQRRGRGGRFFQ